MSLYQFIKIVRSMMLFTAVVSSAVVMLRSFAYFSQPLASLAELLIHSGVGYSILSRSFSDLSTLSGLNQYIRDLSLSCTYSSASIKACTLTLIISSLSSSSSFCSSKPFDTRLGNIAPFHLSFLRRDIF